MSLTSIWLTLVIVTGVAGVSLFTGWRRGELNPPDLRVGLHGGLALLTCGMLLLTFDAKTALGNPELIGLALVIGSGAMMFGARRRSKQCSPTLLWVHIASFAGLCVMVIV